MSDNIKITTNEDGSVSLKIPTQNVDMASVGQDLEDFIKSRAKKIEELKKWKETKSNIKEVMDEDREEFDTVMMLNNIAKKLGISLKEYIEFLD